LISEIGAFLPKNDVLLREKTLLDPAELSYDVSFICLVKETVGFKEFYIKFLFPIESLSLLPLLRELS